MNESQDLIRIGKAVLDSEIDDLSMVRFEEAAKINVSELSRELTMQYVSVVGAFHIAIKISNGNESPYSGAKIISNAIDQHFNYDDAPEQLKVFLGLAAEYEDFFETGQIEFYGLSKCKDIQNDIEKRIHAEAIEFVKGGLAEYANGD